MLITLAFALQVAAALPETTQPTGPVGAEACVASAAPCLIAPGTRYRMIRQAGDKPLVVHVAEIDLATPGLAVRTTPPDRSAGLEYRAQTTSQYVARSGAVLAVNASYFLPFVGGSRGGNDFVPPAGGAAAASGAVLSGGALASPADDIDARVDGMACFGAGRAQIVPSQSCPDSFAEGVAAGPRLIAAGKVLPRPRLGPDGPFRGATRPAEPAPAVAAAAGAAAGGGPRTALGIDATGTKLWIVVADGRQLDWSMGLGHEALIDLFRKLGASDAISLDGGGSATMAARGPAGPLLLSRPIHTGVPGRERPVANHVGVFVDGISGRPDGVMSALAKRPVTQLKASLERIYTAQEARQGVAADASYFYAIVNTVIGKYARDTGKLVARWAGPRGGFIRHLNSCTIVRADLVCAHSNHPEVPHASSVEIWDSTTLAHKASISLGNRDEGSLTIVEPMSDGWLLGFANYSDETGVPFKGHDFSQLIAVDAEWRRREAWVIPPPIRARMAPQAASGGAIGPDGLLYLFGHTLPELYVLARPALGAELVHVATIALDAAGQAFAFDPSDLKRIFAIDRPTGTVRIFTLPDLGPLPADTRRFSRLSVTRIFGSDRDLD